MQGIRIHHLKQQKYLSNFNSPESPQKGRPKKTDKEMDKSQKTQNHDQKVDNNAIQRFVPLLHLPERAY